MPHSSLYMLTLLRTTFLFLLLVSTSYASSHKQIITPEQVEGVTRISAEEFISIISNIPDLVVIDSRITANRKHGFIEGSLSLPDTKTNCNTLAALLKSHDTPVAFYCNGVKCGRSVNASQIALSCGYRNIYWFRGGFMEWKEKEYPYLKHE